MPDKKAIITQIESNVRVCKKCELCLGTRNAVPGEGNIDTKIAFVGEAPGETEDLTGRPFVGRAGKLLEKGLEKIGYNRADVWIGNIIKHRPPENRDPLPDEIAACEGYLAMQLEAIAPLLVVTLGRFSMNYFFVDGKISRDHGRFIKAGAGSKKFNIFPMYHPAAALRNPTVMDEFMKDFIQIPKILDQLKNATSGSVSAQTPIEPEDKNQLGLGL